MSFYTQGTAQTVMWPCKPIILSIGYLEDPTEVLLKSWWNNAANEQFGNEGEFYLKDNELFYNT